MCWPRRGGGTVPGLTKILVRRVQVQRPALASVPGLPLVRVLCDLLQCCRVAELVVLDVLASPGRVGGAVSG